MPITASPSDVETRYPPLDQVNRDLRPRWYRSAIGTTRLRSLLVRDDVLGFRQAMGHFSLYLLAATLVVLCWNRGWWFWLFPALFLLGTVASFFKGTSVHELGHGTVFKTAWLNRLFLYVFSTISWWDPFNYASSHTFHHRYTLHADGDREVLLPLSPMVGKTFLLQLLTFNLYTPPGRTFGKGGFVQTVIATINGATGKTGPANIPSIAWLKALHKALPAQHHRSIWWSRWLLAFHTLVFVFALTSGQWAVFIVLSCASYFANLLSYLLGMTQHCGLVSETEDFRKCTRSIRINPIFEFLYWHMNWHTEHHMYAGVPCYRLPELHDLLKDDMPRPRTLSEAWREMRDTWARQQSDPDYCFDTPVPEPNATAKAIESVTATALPDKEHTSIGSLAPKELD